MPTVLLIAASPSPRSRSAALLAAAAERLQQLGLSTRWLHLNELPAQALLFADSRNAQLQAAVAAVQEAQVVVLATPIYKASFSGLLKVFLDLLPQQALRGKLVWPLASAGSPAHLLALDYALLPVLASLGADGQVGGVYATEAQLPLQASGVYQTVDEIAERLREGATRVVELLPQPLLVD